MQDQKLPDSVKLAFKQKFPSVVNVKWQKEGEKEFEGNFKENGHKMSISFANNGEWINTETKITQSEVPKAVMDALYHKYPAFTYTGADKMETSKYGLLYEIEFKHESKKSEVRFSPSGNEIKP